jgi:hypothetical protein
MKKNKKKKKIIHRKKYRLTKKKRSTIRRKQSKKKWRIKIMAKRKKHHKRSGSMKHHDQIIIMGKRHSKKRHGHSRRGILMGGKSGDLMKRIGSNSLNTAAGVAGGILGAYLSNMLPIVDKKTKAIVPLFAGVVLTSSVNIPAVKFAGLGLSIMAGLSLVKQLLPSVAVLSGEPLLFLPPADGGNMMGKLSDLSGSMQDMSGSDTRLSYTSQADM